MFETPILDLEIDPPRLRRSWTAWAVGATVGAYMVVHPQLRVDWSWWFPLLYASIAIHEVGHLLAGKLVGMEAGGIVVGGLMILKGGSGWVVRFDWKRILSGGLAKPLPRKSDGSSKHAWMIAGGPIASAILAAAGGAVYLRNPDASPGWVNCLWVLNLILLVSTMLPTRGLNKSDGACLWMLLRHPAEARSWVAVLQVQTQDTEGVLPRDWDPELVEEMLRGSPGRGDYSYRHMLAFYRCIDLGDPEAALPHLEKALAGSGYCGKLVRQWCFSEAACSSALLCGSPERAKTWLERALRVRKPESKASVDAAIAMAEGSYQEAIAQWDGALRFIAKRRYDSGLIRFTKAKIAAYQAECRERLARAATASSQAEAQLHP